MSSSFDIKNTTKGKPPGLPFLLLKEKILGPEYELSLVFVGQKKIADLNKQYRQKDGPTDILSFPNTENSGEIFMCLPKVRAKAPEFGRSYQDHVIFLFIHGLLHLKGLDHGSTMDKEENLYFKWLKESQSA